MPETYRNKAQVAIGQLKNNRTGNLKLKNGRLAVDTGTNVYYTTVDGGTAETEAIVGQVSEDLRRAKNASTHTGNLYLSGGKLYATGYIGTITLID